MGGNISKQASDAGDAFGSKVSQKMGEMQQGQMVLSQERMRRMQMAYQIAVTKDRVYWMSAFCGFACLAAIGTKIKLGKTPDALKAPLVILPWLIGYQADMVWGNKMDRINRWALEEAEDNSNWFVPISPSNLDEVPDALKQRPTTKPT